MDDFTILKVIGRGSYAKVLMVELKSTKQIYAMKVIKKALVMDEEVMGGQLCVYSAVVDPLFSVNSIMHAVVTQYLVLLLCLPLPHYQSYLHV